MATVGTASTRGPRANPLAINARYRWIVWLGGGLLLALVAFAFARAGLSHRFAEHALPAVVWAHMAIVLPAIPLGMWLFLNPKGTPAHRLAGKIWLALMIATALVTLGIRNVNHGGFSFIHLFSLYVLVTAPLAWVRARQHRIVAHSRILRGMFVGALIIAGLATFAPGRVLWVWAFG